MEVLLDTNFIISCLLKRIDFLGELQGLGFKPVVPREVFQEMKDLKKEARTSHKEREVIDVAFQLFDREKVKKTKLGGRNVDEGLIDKGKQGVYIASLDREIKRSVPNRIVILAGKKGVGVERG